MGILDEMLEGKKSIVILGHVILTGTVSVPAWDSIII